MLNIYLQQKIIFSENVITKAILLSAFRKTKLKIKGNCQKMYLIDATSGLDTLAFHGRGI